MECWKNGKVALFQLDHATSKRLFPSGKKHKTMKKNLITSIFVLAILSLISCDKNEQLPLSVGEVEKSECKSSDKSAIIEAETSDTLSCIDYSYNSTGKALTMKHINAVFNCCPEKIECDVSLKGDTIVIEESETSSACDCNCLYDLEFEIKNVEKTNYQVKLIEPYAGNEEKIIFEINLSKNISGNWCITRKGYPWGMN